MGVANFVFGNAGPTMVRVTAHDEPLAWLSHFMRPWFDDSGSGPFREVELRIGAAAHDALARLADGQQQTVDCYLLDSRVVRHPVVDRSGGVTWVADRELEVVYGVGDDARVQILAAADGPGTRVALMRVVREMCLVDALADGRPVLHAAVAASTETATAICGRKRSGKTTLLLHMLTTTRARFVANDRCVCSEVTGEWRVRGLPTITALRADTVERFPQVARTVRQAPDRHWLTPMEARPGTRPWADPTRAVDLAPARLCALLGVDAVAEAPITGLVFPRIDPSADGIVERPLSSDETLARLRDAQVGIDYRATYRPIFGRRAVVDASDASDAPDASRSLAGALESLSRLPAVEVRLGARAFDPALAR